MVVGGALGQLRRTDSGLAQRIEGLGEAIGLRNVLAHSYGIADDDVIWRTAESDAADLLRQLTALTAGAGPLDPPLQP